MRIVVADDSQVQQQIVARMVTEGGHEVVGLAHDGSDAVRLCDSLKPDMLLIDIAMVPMDGETAAREVLKQVSPPKIVFVTNQGRQTTRDRAKAIGAGMVVKPFVPAILLREIDRIGRA